MRSFKASLCLFVITMLALGLSTMTKPGSVRSQVNEWNSTGADIYTGIGFDRVGIGTSNPSAALDVQGVIQANGLRPVTLTANRPYGVRIQGDTGGWGVEYGFTGNGGTDHHGFGAFGRGDSLERYYVGEFFNGEIVSFLTDGKVGIGTATPLETLDVNGGARARSLEVRGLFTASGLRPVTISAVTPYGVRIQGDSGGWGVEYGFRGYGGTDHHGFGAFGNGDAIERYYVGRFTTGEIATFLPNGNVGIGTMNPTEKLSVDGTLLAKEVRVSIDAQDFPDYVFSDDYDLMPLDELESTIQEKKRLPGMPSAQEAGRDGIRVGELQRKLLEKVEELTLYVIQLKKRNDLLERQDRELRQRLERIESER